MTWNPLQLKGLSFTGQNKNPAFLEFQNGLNVICGASETGKSFIAEAINFLLGSKDPLRDIPERVGYDQARLVFQSIDERVFTIERSLSGGDFRQLEGNWLLGNPNIEGITLRQKHTQGRDDSLSVCLLSSIGLADKYVRKNKEGNTQSLSFRDIVKLIVIQEDDIIKRKSAIFSGQHITQTAEYSVFKLLLTGVDDSALITHTETQTEIENNRKNNRTKIGFIDEMIEELRSEINEIGISRTEAEAQLLQIQTYSDAQQEIIDQTQRDLNVKIDRRYTVKREVLRFSDRINEINGLLARFDLLKSHYQIDIERLSAIEESGSLFVYLERTSCPLCGAEPNEQHQEEICDGDVESVVYAATAEIAKVEKLSLELDQTMSDLVSECELITTEQNQLEPELQLLNQEIQEITNPLRDARNSFSEIINQSSEMKRVIDLFNRVEQLQEKKSALLTEANKPINNARPQVDLSKSVLDDFAQKIQSLLQAWNFPNSNRVYFDESKKDIVINGKLRSSQGKGLRAITHAAMTIGIMEFCKEWELPHSGFVVLDSPLLAYYAPESDEDSLEGSDLFVRFYEYLANNHEDSQIIILENDHPPSNITGKISSTVFTNNPNQGRYGLFPFIRE